MIVVGMAYLFNFKRGPILCSESKEDRLTNRGYQCSATESPLSALWEALKSQKSNVHGPMPPSAPSIVSKLS